jgi:hypothetical protein
LNMRNFSTNILTNIELLLSFHDTMRRPQMLLESSRPMVSLGSVILHLIPMRCLVTALRVGLKTVGMDQDNPVTIFTLTF